MSIFSWFCRKEVNELNDRIAWMRRELERVADERDEAEKKYEEAKHWLRIDDYPQIRDFFTILCRYEEAQKKGDELAKNGAKFVCLPELSEVNKLLALWFEKYRFPVYGNMIKALDELSKENDRVRDENRRLQHTIDESIARRDELERGAERLKAQNEDAQHCAELFKAAIANGTKFATEAYRKKSRKNMCHAGRISEDTHKLVKDFCKKRKVSFRWIMELSCSICVPLFDSSIIAVQKRAEKEQPKTKIPSAKNVKASRRKVREEMDRNEPRTKRFQLLMKPSVFENARRIAAAKRQSVNNYIETVMENALKTEVE